MTTLDIVLPIRAVVPLRTGELERVQRGLLPSLRTAGYPSVVSTFYVVTPQADMAAVAPLFEGFPDFKFELLADEELLAEIGFEAAAWNEIPGWFKQQLIKLAVSARSAAKAVLILDADIVAINAITPAHFEASLPYQRMGYQSFKGWFEASANALGFDIDSYTEAELNFVMGVTPEYLSSHVVRALLRHLELHSSARWGPHLMSHMTDYSRTWTEFSLYWLWFLRFKERDVDYRPEQIYRWFEDAASITDVSKLTPAMFYVLQSTKLTVEDCAPIYDRFSKII